MSDNRLTYRIALSFLPGINTDLAGILIDAFGSEQNIFDATETELKSIRGMTPNIASPQSRYKALEAARSETEYIRETSINVKWFQDADYPQRLLHSTSAPLIIYTVGECETTGRPTVSIVGTRHATPYGISFTEKLVADLAKAIPDIIIISGLAYGIDIAAHRAALTAGVSTIGIVAHGLATLYPAQHRQFASRMVNNNGAILTEYRHDVNALRGNFLARNRLIALMGDALVVAESAEQGGALSTVRHATRNSRPVFALPGRVTDNHSLGCNKLIADGTAQLISSAEDLISYMGWETVLPEKHQEPSSFIEALTADEKAILHIIATDPTADNDLLATITSLPAHTIMSLMIGLEMKGIVTSTAGNRYQLLIPLNID